MGNDGGIIPSPFDSTMRRWCARDLAIRVYREAPYDGSMSKDVFLSGASGFVGSAVLSELLGRGRGVHALAHRGPVQGGDGRVRRFSGGILDDSALDAAMVGCDAAIHLVGIIAENPSKGVTFDRIHRLGTRKVVEAAKRAGIKRYVHMSAAGVRADAKSLYHQSKFAAEQIVRDSGLDWTIFRPSLIHGPGGGFVEMEIAWARGKALPFVAMPYFGAGVLGLRGGGMLQPIFVRDVARAFVDALENPVAIGRVYELGGALRIDWPGMHRMISKKVVGRPRATMAVPAWYARLLTYLVPRSWLPFDRGQVIMGLEDNTTDVEPFVRDFGWRPRGLDETVAESL